MATKQQIIATNLAHPTWTMRQVADHLGCKIQLINTYKDRYALSFPRDKSRLRNPRSIFALGRAARDAGLTVEDLQSIAEARVKVERAMAR